ncbi:MAG: hypothetical protein EPO21_24375 [Chloroflexota bacterium]|nr:MAG: hypothetical protein EPO21_24375 [Chloroflexota bacterium]
MKKSLIILALIAALIGISWILALLTILLMNWAAVWPAARTALTDESAVVAATILAVFVAESLIILGGLVYTITKFPETIGAAVDIVSAMRGRRPGRRSDSTGR